MYEYGNVNGAEFARRVSKLGKQRGVVVWLDERHGKGSHARLYFGTAFTTVKDRRKEIGKGLLASMLRDLGLSLEDIR